MVFVKEFMEFCILFNLNEGNLRGLLTSNIFDLKSDCKFYL